MAIEKQIQEKLIGLGYSIGKVDGVIGPLSKKATLQALAELEAAFPKPKPIQAGGKIHVVMASSFADPRDISAFRRCKAQGKSDQECFKVGDNGIGCWGDDTTGDLPMCALPRDDWKKVPDPRLKPVVVVANGKQVVCLLGDTMPWKKNIRNGCGIDLNPAAVKALGLRPPIKIKATWAWA